MSKILLLPLFLFLSCVSSPETKQTAATVGTAKRFEPLMVSYEDGERIKAICSALSTKEDQLDVLSTANTQYTFSYGQKGCADAKASAPKTIATTIQRTDGNNFVFKATGGDAFGFSDVETSTSGVMATICQNSSSLVSPLQTSKTGATWFTTYMGSELCKSDANHFCIHIQRGSTSNSLDYNIHTNEWIKFRITNEKRGFFVERTLISSAGCSKKQTIEKTAVLK
jgi:hypothetical protein